MKNQIDIKMLQRAKDEVAVANGKKSWQAWDCECSEPYGKDIPSKYLEEAFGIYINSIQEEYKKTEKMHDELVELLKEAKILLNDFTQWIPAGYTSTKQKWVDFQSKLTKSILKQAEQK